MAPEQWTGEPTAQSDLYSLGVVLYEMITGHRPYTADTPAGVLLKQATESLPLPKTIYSRPAQGCGIGFAQGACQGAG